MEDSKSDGDESPTKLNFDLSQYELQQQLLLARREIETQSNQILSLEATLSSRPPVPTDAPEDEKDRLILDQAKTIRELEIVVQGYEDNLGEPLRAVREDVEQEWVGKVAEERRLRDEKEAWAQELVRQLERERQVRLQRLELLRAMLNGIRQIRQKLEDEKRALQAFVADIEQIQIKSRSQLPRPVIGGASVLVESRKRSAAAASGLSDSTNAVPRSFDTSPFRPKSKLQDQRLEEVKELDERPRVLTEKENLV